MDIKEAYNAWSSQYDTDLNKTRDIEAIALRQILGKLKFERCLELGCGTGKNTLWLAGQAVSVTAVDFSQKMIDKARDKVKSGNINFVLADISKNWAFPGYEFDLITFSLVLEHIENLDHIFAETSKRLTSGGYVYMGELHPFKQYSGSKARFVTAEGLQVPECFTHHISDFLTAASDNRLKPVELKEHFDDDNRNNIPRLLTILFRKE